MDFYVGVDTIFPTSPATEEEHGMGDVKKGPWTDEEDEALVNYVRVNGEGRWNSVARYAGLRRTGKSCRLRWLNYLRPDVRRGNITLEEQLMILDLHSRWGNRWSKIAKYLPGRTDNEIKNYWRTRVQKQAKQFNCDVNSQQFRDAMQYVWIPRMMERVQANSSKATSGKQSTSNNPNIGNLEHTNFAINSEVIQSSGLSSLSHDPMFMPEMSGTSSDSSGPQNSSVVSNHSEFYSMPSDIYFPQTEQRPVSDNTSGQSGWTYFDKDHMFDVNDDSWFPGAEDQSVMLNDNFWNIDNIGFLQRQLSDEVL